MWEYVCLCKCCASFCQGEAGGSGAPSPKKLAWLEWTDGLGRGHILGFSCGGCSDKGSALVGIAYKALGAHVGGGRGCVYVCAQAARSVLQQWENLSFGTEPRFNTINTRHCHIAGWTIFASVILSTAKTKCLAVNQIHTANSRAFIFCYFE